MVQVDTHRFVLPPVGCSIDWRGVEGGRVTSQEAVAMVWVGDDGCLSSGGGSNRRR